MLKNPIVVFKTFVDLKRPSKPEEGLNDFVDNGLRIGLLNIYI